MKTIKITRAVVMVLTVATTMGFIFFMIMNHNVPVLSLFVNTIWEHHKILRIILVLIGLYYSYVVSSLLFDNGQPFYSVWPIGIIFGIVGALGLLVMAFILVFFMCLTLGLIAH